MKIVRLLLITFLAFGVLNLFSSCGMDISGSVQVVDPNTGAKAGLKVDGKKVSGYAKADYKDASGNTVGEFEITGKND